MSRRQSVDGWRWDYLTPEGWFPSSQTRELHTGRPLKPEGWYTAERAVCLINDHRAPHPDCCCGVHGVEFLTPAVADRLEELDAKRAVAIADGRVGDDDVLILALSRVRFHDVLPTAWPDDAQALASHPDAIPDPPHTIRAHRKEYLEIFLDRRSAVDALEANPPMPGWPPLVYVPDLAAWVRGQCAGDLDAFLEEVLG